jgi:hypothetical protein
MIYNYELQHQLFLVLIGKHNAYVKYKSLKLSPLVMITAHGSLYLQALKFPKGSPIHHLIKYSSGPSLSYLIN